MLTGLFFLELVKPKHESQCTLSKSLFRTVTCFNLWVLDLLQGTRNHHSPASAANFVGVVLSERESA